MTDEDEEETFHRDDGDPMFGPLRLCAMLRKNKEI